MASEEEVRMAAHLFPDGRDRKRWQDKTEPAPLDCATSRRLAPPANRDAALTIDTIPKRLFDRGLSMPDAPAYMTKVGGVWKEHTYAQYAKEVRQAARSLISMGFQPGQVTTILGFNRPEWVILDVATMAVGGAPAGIYTTSSPEEIAYILDHSEAPLILVENAEQAGKVEAKRAEHKHLKHIVVMRGPAVPGTIAWDDFLARGDATPDRELDGRIEELTPDQMATLIYTSGTTGPPKAVMLTHENLAWTSQRLVEVLKMKTRGRTLSYLPLSHIAEQTASIHGPISSGGVVYFAESLQPEKIVENLRESRPTLFFGVPRIWERFHAVISGRMREATGAKAKVASWAMRVGAEVSSLRAVGREPGGALAIQYRLANRLVFSTIKKGLGLDQAETLVSGAAPIGRDVLDFFASLDLIIQEVYGQSEDTGPTSFNLTGRTKLGTVGPPLPGVDVKIAEDGEILVKGKNVFPGYYKDAEATKEALTGDGWLRSGDLGAIDAQGFLSITGRKKEILITAGGKNITPKNIEAALKESPLVSEAVVIGDRRKYLTALIWLEEAATKKWMEAKGLTGSPIASAEVRAEIEKVVESANSKLARVEQIKKFAFPPRPLGIDTGELTPTLKIKRKKVDESFGPLIESMYD
jgi:long-chain acyl-CoA synthetase